MKTYSIFLILVAVLTTTSCIHFENDTNISLAYRDSDDEYSFTGNFEEHKTAKVEDYIEKSLHENWLFGQVEDREDYTATLEDKTKIHIKASHGKLKIVLDKDENSRSSYLRVKKVCEGIKEILKDK